MNSTPSKKRERESLSNDINNDHLAIEMKRSKQENGDVTNTALILDKIEAFGDTNEIVTANYQSDLKNLFFLNYFLKCELPLREFESNFSQVVRFEEKRSGTKCSILLDYHYNSGQLDFYLQIGEGEDIERQVDIDKILEGTWMKESRKIDSNLLHMDNSLYNTKPYPDMENFDVLEQQREISMNNTPSNYNMSPRTEHTRSPRTLDREVTFNLNDQIQLHQRNEEGLPTLNSNDFPSYTSNVTFYFIDYKHHKFTFRNTKSGEVRKESIPLSKEIIHRLNNPKHVLVFEIVTIKNNPKPKGRIGLINEGMTCYMNSLFQTLNILGYLKKAIFSITEREGKRSVISSLQKLFYDLLKETKSVSTGELIASFGWSREQMLMQQDIQEFFIKLSEVMEHEMKGTSVAGTFKFLFEGKVLNYIQCVDVDYRSSKEETFSDLQLTVKGCKDIYSSFDKYTEEEILEDKYEADGYGKQNAKKGIRFITLPNVLILQLKRFEYNQINDTMEKINDYFEYYDQIDLNKYTVTSECSNEFVYNLHSVVVHSGSSNGGHYYAFIKPNVDSKWIKYDDENVMYSEAYEVFYNNFGGNTKIFRNVTRGNIIELNFKCEASAYILVYIKQSMRGTILQCITDIDVPEGIRDMIEREKIHRRKLELVALRDKSYININLFSIEVVQHSHKSLGLTTSIMPMVDSDKIPFDNIKKKLVLNIPNIMKIRTLINVIGHECNIPPHLIQIYKYTILYNNNILKRFTYKMTHVNESYYDEKVIDISSFKPQKKYILFLHVLDKSKVFEENKQNNTEEHEHEIIASDGSMVYYDSNRNYWKFSFNDKTEYTQGTEDTLIIEKELHSMSQISNRSPFTLIVVKYLSVHISSTGEFMTNLNLDSIVTVRKDQNLRALNIDFRQRYKEYLDKSIIDNIPNFDRCHVSFLMEATCLDETLSSLSPTLAYNSVFNANMDTTFSCVNNDALCVIISLEWLSPVNFSRENLNLLRHGLKSIITLHCDKIIRCVPVNFSYHRRNGEDKHLNKFLSKEDCYISLTMTEVELKKKIISMIKRDNLLNFLLYHHPEHDSPDKTFFLDELNVLHSLDDIIKPETYSIIELIVDNSIVRNPISLNVEFPMLKILDPSKMNLRFTLNFLRYKQIDLLRTHLCIEIFLFDEHNNPMHKIYILLRRYCETISEILNEIKCSVIKRFYSNLQEDFDLFFFIQHPINLVIFEFFLNPSTKLLMYEKENLLMDYRLQPFEKRTHPLMEDSNKIFVCVYSNQNTPVCHPFMLFADLPEAKLKEVRVLISSTLRGIIQLKDIDVEDSNKIRLYSCSILNTKPIKGHYLNPSLNEEKFIDFFNGNILFNVLVEIHHPTYSNNSLTINSK